MATDHTPLESLIWQVKESGNFNLTCWQNGDGKFQANFSRNKKAWRITYGNSPEEAIRKVLIASQGMTADDLGDIESPIFAALPKKKKPVDDFEDLLG